MIFNYHTHSKYCDGKNELEEYVQAAIEKGFRYLGFSGHAPVPFENHFAIKEEELNIYCDQVRKLKEKYASQIKLFLSLEMDYIPDMCNQFQELRQQCQLDFVIGSVHLVRNRENEGLWFIDGGNMDVFDKQLQDIFDGDIKAGVTAFYEQTMEMIITQNPDVVGHIDKVKMNNKGRYFREEDRWIQELEDKTLEVLKTSGCICEVNTRGLYKKRHHDFYPSKSLLKKMFEQNIPVTISTDAHIPSELDLYFYEAAAFLKQIGYKEVYIYDGIWKAIGINEVNKEGLIV